MADVSSTIFPLARAMFSQIKQFLGNNNKGWFGWLIMFNATFNNISVISWQSVLLVEETGVPGENHGLVASH